MLGRGFGSNGSETMKKQFYGSVNIMKCEAEVCEFEKMVKVCKCGKALNKIALYIIYYMNIDTYM